MEGLERRGKDVYPPIVDEQMFWAVQEKFNNNGSRPKKELDPLPLAGLLYCGNHDILQRMNYANGKQSRSSCQCIDSGTATYCAIITAHILDTPISEAVLDLSDLAQVLQAIF